VVRSLTAVGAVVVIVFALAVTAADSFAQGGSVVSEPHVFVSERLGPGGPTPAAQVQAELLVPANTTTAHVEYGLTPAYGQRTPEEPQAGTAMSVNLLDLQFGVIYHYRMVVTVNGFTFAGSNATLFVPYPALHLPARVDVRVAGLQVRGRTRLRSLTLRGVPRGTRTQVSSCAFRREPVCSMAAGFTTTRDATVFMRNRAFAPGTGVSVTAIQPDGQVVDTDVKFRAAGPPEVTVACGLARPGESDYSEQPCVAIRTFSRAASPAVALRVEGVQDGMTVEILCRGAGCTRSRTVRQVELPLPGVPVTVVPQGFSRLRPGSVLDVSVTRPRTTGVARRIVVGRRSASVGPYRCVARDSLVSPSPCPSGLHLPFPAAPAAVQLY
jgi:hypothetical protein